MALWVKPPVQISVSPKEKKKKRTKAKKNVNHGEKISTAVPGKVENV
jgi:hypothetical protein